MRTDLHGSARGQLFPLGLAIDGLLQILVGFDPLVVWSSKLGDDADAVLIDGHNRYEICQRHGIKFTVKKMEFKDEDAACVWIIRNQFGRRNLSPLVRVELTEKLVAVQSRQGQRNDLNGTSRENSRKVERPSEAKATTAGVDPKTYRAAKAVLDAEKRGDIKPEVVQDLRQGKGSVHRVAKEIKETQAKEKRQEKRMEAAKDAPAVDERIIVGDFRQNPRLDTSTEAYLTPRQIDSPRGFARPVRAAAG
jgi:ParB-like chromosome segregation protein Spo0J